MSVTAGVAMQLAADLLNDSPRNRYTDTVLLPFFNLALSDLIDEFQIYEVRIASKQDAAVTITAGGLVFTPLPTLMMLPISLYEKAEGAPDRDFKLIHERRWLPFRDQNETLNDWALRDGAINFVGATTNRDVVLRYLKGFGEASSGATSFSFREAKTYLGERTAAIQAAVTEDYDRAKALASLSQESLMKLVNKHVKKDQARPIRRRPFRRFRRR